MQLLKININKCVEKMLKNKWLSKRDWHGNVNVDVHMTTSLRCFQIPSKPY